MSAKVEWMDVMPGFFTEREERDSDEILSEQGAIRLDRAREEAAEQRGPPGVQSR